MNYENPKAQYYLGKIFLEGEGKEKLLYKQHDDFNFQQKRNPSAQAMLGNILLQEEKIIRSTEMLTAAYEKANVKDKK